MRTGTDRNVTGRNNVEICGAPGDSWVTWSCEWWYIQRSAAEVMLGALVPYAACSAFSTRAMALKWCSFQKLGRWEGWQTGQYQGVTPGLQTTAPARPHSTQEPVSSLPVGLLLYWAAGPPRMLAPSSETATSSFPRTQSLPSLYQWSRGSSYRAQAPGFLGFNPGLYLSLLTGNEHFSEQL